MRVIPVRQLVDNYAYLIVDERSRSAAVVDVAEAEPVLAAADEIGVPVDAILSTHHHFDHVGGNTELVEKRRPAPIRVYGYAEDQDRIPGLTDALADGDEFTVGSLRGKAIFIPAHTRGHLAFYFADEKVVFTGDTLFAGGCGRLFEGDAAQMMASLSRLVALPGDTRVYCGHEYTKRNLEFAALLEPGNRDLAARREAIDRMLAEGKPTVPTTIDTELRTNPFLRSDSEELARSVMNRKPGVAGDRLSIFAATRSLKDDF
jgi:hydroxyacylglutathione hydrolase